MALPEAPRASDVFGKSLIFDLRYEGGDVVSGGQAIGSPFFLLTAEIGWVGDTIFALIPHARRAADRFLERNPGYRITNGCDTWEIPDGLREISEAEKDLLIAQHRVEREAKAKGTTQAPA